MTQKELLKFARDLCVFFSVAIMAPYCAQWLLPMAMGVCLGRMSTRHWPPESETTKKLEAKTPDRPSDDQTGT